GIGIRTPHPSVQGVFFHRACALSLALLVLSQSFARPDPGLDERDLSNVGRRSRRHDHYAGELVSSLVAPQADDGPPGLRGRRQSRPHAHAGQERGAGQADRARRLGLSAASGRPFVRGRGARQRRGSRERPPEHFRLALLHAPLSRWAGSGTRPLHRILETLRHEPRRSRCRRRPARRGAQCGPRVARGGTGQARRQARNGRGKSAATAAEIDFQFLRVADAAKSLAPSMRRRSSTCRVADTKLIPEVDVAGTRYIAASQDRLSDLGALLCRQVHAAASLALLSLTLLGLTLLGLTLLAGLTLLTHLTLLPTLALLTLLPLRGLTLGLVSLLALARGLIALLLFLATLLRLTL